MSSNLKLKLIRTLINIIIKLKINRIIPMNSKFVYNIADNIIKSTISSEDIFEVENFKMVKGRTTRYSILTGRLCEYSLSILIKNKIKNGMIVFDIGANIGGTSLLFSKLVGSQGHVYAFEPDPTLCVILKRNIELNNLHNVSIFQTAVSDKIGTSFFSLNSEQDGDNRLESQKIGKDSIQVKTISIDEFCKEQKILPDFIKIDIQGFEPKAIQGMLNLFHDQPNLKLLTEFYPSAILDANSSPKEFLLNLQKFGFIIHQISDSGQLEEFSIADLLKIKNDDYVDLYCTKLDFKK